MEYAKKHQYIPEGKLNHEDWGQKKTQGGRMPAEARVSSIERIFKDEKKHPSPGPSHYSSTAWQHTKRRSNIGYAKVTDERISFAQAEANTYGHSPSYKYDLSA